MTGEEWYNALKQRHGEDLQRKFSSACVAVCGLGGLGSNVAISLARAGIGTLILKAGIRVAIEKFCADRIAISAQLYARGLYEGVGFVQTSDEYLEDDIPHARMELSCADFIKGDK